jgi:hypothetical protein
VGFMRVGRASTARLCRPPPVFIVSISDLC